MLQMVTGLRISDSQPVAVKMDLSLLNLRPIYEQDQLDTPEDSVGY